MRVKGPLWRLTHSPTQVGSSEEGAGERKAAALAFGEQASFPSPNPASFPTPTCLLSLAARTPARSSAFPKQERAGGCACAV